MKTRVLIVAASALLGLLASSTASAQITKQDAQRALDAYRTRTLPVGLSPAQKEALQGVVGLLRKNDLTGAKTAWQKFLNGYITRTTAKSIGSIENWVLNESIVKDEADVEAVIEQWEEQLQTTGDDAQLANIDLQNMLQKQQQTIQMLSSVSKVLHDTAMAVIRKIG